MEELHITACDLRVDVVAVTETWFQPDLPLQYVSIPDYELLSKARTGRTGGGVALYSKFSLNAKLVPFLQPPNHPEVLWTQFRPKRLPRSVTSIFTAVVYYPQPNAEIADELIEHLRTSIDQILTKYPGAAIIILGDFNQLDLAPLLSDSRFRQVVNNNKRRDCE